MVNILLYFFVVAVAIGYYFDYKKNKETYGKKGQGLLYLLAIGTIIIFILKKIFV